MLLNELEDDNAPCLTVRVCDSRRLLVELVGLLKMIM